MDQDAFLKQEVESASPAKLRWLLLRRAVGLSHAVRSHWLESNFEQSMEWWIRLKEILSELLEGVTDRENPVAKPVSDLYVFLIRMAIELEKTHDLDSLNAFIEILSIEQETWDIVHRRASHFEDRHNHLDAAPQKHSVQGASLLESEQSSFSFDA